MKKRILFLMADLGGGGAEKVLVNLVNALPAEKYDITIRTIFKEGVNVKFLAPHIKYSALLPCKMLRGYVGVSKLFSPKFLYKLLVKDKYDIEIAFMMHVPTRVLGGSDSSAKKYTWSHTLHVSSKAFRCKSEFINIYRHYDGIAFVSRDGLNDFTKHYLSHPYAKVVHNVVNTEGILKKGQEDVSIPLAEDTINLFSVGRLCREKGYIRLVEVLGQLYYEGLRNWHLYLIGEGGEKDSIIEAARLHGLTDFITLLGFKTNPYKYAAKMDLFVCSSETEGYSTAVTESVILGVPVLTTACSGMEEIFADSGCGLIVPNSSEGLETGLREVLTNPVLLPDMKERAEARSRDFCTDKLIAEFETFINGKS